MNPSKAKGTRFEREVADYLAEVIPGVDRKALHGGADHGDIANVPGWALECKATKALDLGGAIDEARVEAKNSKSQWFAAIVKRRHKGTAEAYVVMTLEQYRRLVPSIFVLKPLTANSATVTASFPAPTVTTFSELTRQQQIGGG